jgi:uncharacterized membrane protein (UPF0127 family)
MDGMHSQKKEYTTLSPHRCTWLIVAGVVVCGVLALKGTRMLDITSPGMPYASDDAVQETQQIRDWEQLSDQSQADAQFVRADQPVTSNFKVIAVNTPRSIEQGLSGQPTMPANGMLFLLPDLRIPRFWMIDMQFDLDMIWLRDGIVVDVTEGVPAPEPDTAPYDLPTYSPKELTNQVLEVPAGFVQQYGVSIGDQLELTAE